MFMLFVFYKQKYVIQRAGEGCLECYRKVMIRLSKGGHSYAYRVYYC